MVRTHFEPVDAFPNFQISKLASRQCENHCADYWLLEILEDYWLLKTLEDYWETTSGSYCRDKTKALPDKFDEQSGRSSRPKWF